MKRRTLKRLRTKRQPEHHHNDWETATNLAGHIQQASGRYTNSVANESLSPALKTLIWPSINEMIGTYEQFHEWDNKWLHRFGREIIDSIPAESIYLGGTDPGRYIISALTEPPETGKHIFVLTQNQLADQTYWRRFTGELIGNWLTNDTPVKEVCDFADRVFLDKNLDGFKGDTGFAKNQDAQKTFSKLRSSLGGMYVWRAEHD